MTQSRLIAIGEVVAPVRTWTPEREAPDKLFTYIDLGAIDQDTKQIVNGRQVLGGEAPSRARQIVAAGDVLVSTVRPNLNGVARVPIRMNTATVSTGFCVLRPKSEKLDGAYLFHWVRSTQFVEEMVRKATGASYPAVSDRIVFESKLPLPSLAEQRRISGILDKADALRTKRRAALIQLDTLTQSIFLEMFGDAVANTRGWPTKSLPEVCYCYSGGTPSKADPDLWRGTVPWFSAKDLKSPDLFDSTDHISHQITENSTLRLLPANTVAIVVRGMILAHTFPISVLRIPSTINQDLKALLPKVPIEPQFLAACLRSAKSLALQQVSEAGHGTKRLDANGLREIPVLLPPMQLQREFVLRIEQVEKLRIAAQASLHELDSLFASLQHRAFRGALFRRDGFAEDFDDSLKLSPDKAIEAIIYVASKIPGHNFYKSLKTLYFADKQHLKAHGRLIYGETYAALPMGPVPQAAYDAAKYLNGEQLMSEIPEEKLRAALRRTQKQLIPLRPADTSKLSPSELESLNWAIHQCGPLTFDQLKRLSHDSAYERTKPNVAIRLEDLLEMVNT